MAEIVYILCALTSSGCAILLLRQYRSSRSRLLFWSSLCFVGLAFNNAFLVVDLLIFPNIDLRLLRSISAFIALAPMVFGSVWSGVSND